MKIEWNKKYTTIAVYTLLVIIAGVLVFQILNNFSYFKNAIALIWKLLLPFVYGFSFAYIFNPVLSMFEKRFFPWLSRGRMGRKANRYLSVTCTMIVALLVISLFVGLIVPQLVISIGNVITQITDYAAEIPDYLTKFTNSDAIVPVIKDIMGYMQDYMRQVMEMLSASFSGIINTTISTTISITSTIINIFVGFIIAIYVWIAKETFFAQIKKLMYAFLPSGFVVRLSGLAKTANQVFSGFIIGKIIDSLIIGVLCYIGMLILNIPFALLISVIVGVTNIIPYFGPFIGAIPSTLLLLLVDPVKGLWFAIFILVLQQVDGNIIGPKILGESTGLSAFWVIFAVTLFGGLFGFVGMLIGVPLFAVIYAIIKEASEKRLADKQMSVETHAYASEDNPLLPKERRGKKTKK